MIAHAWSPIKNLGEGWLALESPNLKYLGQIWREKRTGLEGGNALKDFDAKLRREWSIETGIIEGLYHLDRGVTRTLIDKGLEASLIPFGTANTPGERVVPVLRDHEDVLNGLFDFVARRRELSTSYIKEIHQAFTRNQHTTEAVDQFGKVISVELLKGEWKRAPNNPTKSDGSIHQYCPPEHVASEMDNLVSWHNEHIGLGVPPEVEAAWLHHRFTQIHPFQDGNGRIARALASLVLIRAKFFPLVMVRESRSDYIDALQHADKLDDLRPLVELIAKHQESTITRAIGLSNDVLTGRPPIDEIVSDAAARIRSSIEKLTQVPPHVHGLVDELSNILNSKLKSISKKINEKIDAHDYKKFLAETLYLKSPDDLIISMYKNIMEDIGLIVNEKSFSRYFKINLPSAKSHPNMIFGIFGIGHQKPEFGTCLACVNKDLSELPNLDGIRKTSYEVIGGGPFQWTFIEPNESVLKRFDAWVDAVLLEGLNRWRRRE